MGTREIWSVCTCLCAEHDPAIKDLNFKDCSSFVGKVRKAPLMIPSIDFRQSGAIPPHAVQLLVMPFDGFIRGRPRRVACYGYRVQQAQAKQHSLRRYASA